MNWTSHCMVEKQYVLLSHRHSGRNHHSISDVEITRRSREHDFKTLGVWITFDGHFIKDFMKELAKPEVSAWRCFSHY